MAAHLGARATPDRSDRTRTDPERAAHGLRVAKAPTTARRSIGDVGTLLAFGLFVVCLALAALHAVLVQNQAALDDLIGLNELRQDQVDQLQAEIAYLDSPEGLAGQALSAGLVPAAELVTLTPVGPGLLPAPPADPFGLAFIEPNVGSSIGESAE